MGKGSKRRPEQVKREIADLRWKLAFGKLSDSEKEHVKQQITELEQRFEQNVLLNNNK